MQSALVTRLEDVSLETIHQDQPVGTPTPYPVHTLIIKTIVAPRRKCGIAVLGGRKIKVTRNNK